jgi:hypothetical protein
MGKLLGKKLRVDLGLRRACNKQHASEFPKPENTELRLGVFVLRLTRWAHHGRERCHIAHNYDKNGYNRLRSAMNH